ncbi:MAG: hypothetical protein KA152_14980, partial [Verrucomicrobiales bacterium]|nr:hypothetical protein [Verrucomicrobiales bacterium]
MSANPRKKSKRPFNLLKFVLIGGGIFLVLLVAGLLIAKSSLNAWLHGEGFRDWLAKRAATVLRSEVTLADLTWSGSEVYVARFNALGSEEASFAELGLDGVRAKVGGIRDKAFRVPEVTVNRFSLEFSHRRKGSNPTAATRGDGEGSGPTLPSWLSKFAPNRVEMEKIIISTASVSVVKPEG